MALVKTFDTRVDADIARIALRGEGIAAQVVGVDLALSGGAQGVQLLVADEDADAARKILTQIESDAGRSER